MAANSALDKVMDQATQAAETFQAPVPQTTAPGTDLATQNAPGQLAKPSMTSFVESGGMSVDNYLAMDKVGFQAGDMEGYFKEAIVELDMSSVIPIYQSRGEVGGKTTFLKSYDGVTTSTGQNFANAVAHQQATSKSTGVYPTAEIPCELLEDITDGSVTIEAGSTIGITPSLTGFKEFQSFVKSLTKSGLQDAVLKVRVKHKQRSNANNNKWGVATFELIEKIRD